MDKRYRKGSIFFFNKTSQNSELYSAQMQVTITLALGKKIYLSKAKTK